MIMDGTFITSDTCLHGEHIILLGLLPTFHITLQLEFLCFEIITGVIFIADSKRYNVQLLQTVDDRTVATHRHHLEDRLLSTVITVFGTPLTLCYPDIDRKSTRLNSSHQIISYAV